MATKKEKLIGTLIGGIIGITLANGNNNSTQYLVRGALLGGISGYGFSCLFGSSNDTINYTHFYKGKRVYEGVTYKSRFEKRMAEHRANGKLFDCVRKDFQKPRVEALELEKERIQKFNPINNIQHNNLNTSL